MKPIRVLRLITSAAFISLLISGALDAEQHWLTRIVLAIFAGFIVAEELPIVLPKKKVPPA